MRSCVLLVAAVVLWAALLPAVLACDCCERNATLSECGPGSELRSRPDCDCCTACARLRDQSCNDSDQPCAEGLDCSSERVCTDPEKCRSDGDCHESRFCLGGVCTDPCQVLDHCDGLLRHGACQVRNHRPVCTCPPTLTLDAEKKACVKGPGCQTDDGKQLSSGEKTARSNCSETCLCEANGTLSCTPTQCPPGLYVSGAFADDPSCVELKSSNADPCCVSVVCPDEPSSEEQKGATEAPAAPTTTEPDPTTPPGAETATAPDAALDVLPLSITHNSTQLQLPSTGGRLTYRADGRPPVTVNGTEQLDRVTVTGLLPGTGYVFTWVGPAGNKKLRVDTRPGCVTNTTSYGVGETYHMGCQSTCVCGGPNQPACRPRCSVARGTVTDPLCSERPDPADPECCVELVCAASSPADEILAEEPETTELPSTTTSSSTTESTTTSAEPSTTTTEDTPSSSPSTEPSLPKPSLIVTARSHSAVTLAWDDFQPPQYAQGYVLQYRRTGGDYPWQRRELPPQRGQTVPLAKVDGLMPGTEYEARVSLHADNDPDALGDSTETTRFTTDDGCVEGEKSYAVGEKFSRGCEESCTCELKGRVQCAPRCPPPLFRAGHFSADPLCKETALDDCCVTAVCDTAPLDEHHQQGADGVDQCEFVHCGPNSQCEMMKAASSGGEADSMEARCICAPGFTQSWDKPDTCVKDSGNVILNRTGCEYDGMLYTPGDEFFKSCEYRCRCSVKNQVECKPRCKVDQSTMLDLPAGCVRVHEPEPNQHCCMELKCDNATSAEESTSEGPFMEDPLEGESISTRFGAARLDPASSDLRIVGLDAVDAGSTSVRVEVPEAVARELSGSLKEAPVTVQWRYIGDGAWESRTVPHRLLHLGDRLLTMLVTGFGRPGDAILKVSLNGETSAEVRGADLLSEQDGGKMNEEHTGANHEQPTGQEPAADTAEPIPDEGFDCVFNGTSYKIGDEFHDGCRQFCLCTSTGVSCAAIECPHHFGLKLINPDCLEWSHPEDFHPTPPNCCPEVTCIDDGSCQFRGETFRNLEKLPEKLTGCDVCYCEFGNVTCQSSCAPVPATPPRELPCSPDQITLGPGPNGCCKLWQCSDDVPSRPSVSVPSSVHTEGLGIGQGNDIDNLRVRDVKPNSVQFSFSIPPALVGLPGRTEVLYTDNPSFGAESTDWDRRVFQTPSGLLDRTDFVWTLGDLRPATTYLMQAKVVFEQVSTILQSSIVEFRTRDPPEPEVALPPKVELDAELQELEVDTNSAEIQWRRLSDQELNYVDGIQLRYRDVDVDAQVWTMTPFIHRELTSYRLTDLKPDTTYEVDIVLMPFTDKHTEMVSSHSIQIHTQAVVDRYAFNVSLTNVEPGPTSVRVNWTGVPKPQYQFVNVYRIVYIYEKEREEKHTFKLAKTSESPSVLIKGLKPSSKYQVWLEAYLKNGKKQVSEVREFVTKPGPIGKAEEIRVDAAGFGGKLQPSDDYYGGMVAAAIIATIAILLCLFLAFLLVRRPPKPAEPTTPARKNGPSYENPAFKNSDLDMNGSNGNERFS
ncbi:uncharacterized protein LOC122388618 isoform X5 [Amphibalanus amphitrite]|uniref:uncharacterized protein LOC122388618 isoform X5 n=1 Tax=Amphibalanus amphitrite TaxID=1232801 RepID=UPI001C905E77|nr:uncharacterized protein LOC122388618 isoform X5 [Amphibalanus amphitrite]